MLAVQKKALHYRSLVRFYVQLRKVLPAHNRLERSVKSILNECKAGIPPRMLSLRILKNFSIK